MAGWLHHVVRHIARRARSGSARRKRKEDEADRRTRAKRSEAEQWRRLRRVLDEALDELPERYRTPIILHHLEGCTLEETAQRLRCKTGTLCSWLARGRNLLRRRVERRGIAITVPVLFSLVSEHAAASALPASVITDTAAASVYYFSGNVAVGGTISATSAAWAKGAMHAMMISKLKWTGALALATCLVCSTTVVLVQRVSAEESQGKDSKTPLVTKEATPPPGTGPDTKVETRAKEGDPKVIRRNESAAAGACMTYAEAQDIYRRTDWDRDGVLEYAQRIAGDFSLHETKAGAADILLLDAAFAAAEGLPVEPKEEHFLITTDTVRNDVASRIPDLDSDNFKTRQAALKGIGSHGLAGIRLPIDLSVGNGLISTERWPD